MIHFTSSAPEKLIQMKEKTMEKSTGETMAGKEDDLREHYDFDYSKAKPNRFAERIQQDSLMIVLDPDVASVFPTAKSVNDTLRAIAVALENLPPTKSGQRRKRSARPQEATPANRLVG